MPFAEHNSVSCSVCIVWRASCDHSDPDFFCSIKWAAGKANFFFSFLQNTATALSENVKKKNSFCKKTMTSNCSPSAHNIMHFIKRRRRRRRAQGKRHRTEITRTLNLNTHLHFSSFAPALGMPVFLFELSRFHSLLVAFSFFFFFVTPLISLGKFQMYFWTQTKKKYAEMLFFPLLYRCQTFKLFFLGRDALKADFFPFFLASSSPVIFLGRFLMRLQVSFATVWVTIIFFFFCFFPPHLGVYLRSVFSVLASCRAEHICNLTCTCGS